ncbi:MAG: hypothetical protein SGI72_05420 [Planctomycetota bacterium]|nr:hypothetical protein [Planctomycetota bacterium]
MMRTHARSFVVAATLVCGACSPRSEKVASYALSNVVASSITELEARLAQSESAIRAPVTADMRERVFGLVESFSSTDARLRSMAVTDAKTLSSAELEAVTALLTDEEQDPSLRDGAARVLGEHTTGAAGEALCAMLEKGRVASVRRQCAFQFGRVAQPQFAWRLGLRLKYEVDGETVVWIAQALSRYGNLSGLAGLRVLAETSRDEGVRELAARVAQDIAVEHGATEALALETSWNSGAFEAARPAVAPDDRMRLEGWRRIERLSLFDLRQVDDARFSLVSLGDWITPQLAAALHDSNAYTRVHAAQCLERRGARSRAAIDSLIAALREPRVAPNAAAALAAIGDARASGPLVGALEQRSNLDLRVAAARGLGTLKAQAALDPLTRAFAASEPADLRQASAEAVLAIDARAEAFDHLKELFAKKGGDTHGAEIAIGLHLATLATRDDAARALYERWSALDVHSGFIPTAAETETRQSARSALLR